MLIFQKDITAQIGEFIYPSEVNMPTYKPTLNYNKKQLKGAMEAISNAKNLLYIEEELFYQIVDMKLEI